MEDLLNVLNESHLP